MKTIIIYEDTDIIVCRKPAGIAVQSARIGQADMVSELKNYRSRKGEEPYIGLIHRLDQPVSGVMVFAKTKQAAANLSNQVAQRDAVKEYEAVVHGIPGEVGERKELVDFLLKDGKTNTSSVVAEGTKDSKKADLEYEVVEVCEDTARIHITLHTGRHHQIRVQFSHAGFPLVGDKKYGIADQSRQLMLCSCKIGFTHPKTNKWMEFETNINDR